MKDRVPETIVARQDLIGLSEQVSNPENIPEGAHSVKVVTDSRANLSEAIFIGISGENRDGSSFAVEALERGASGVVVGPSYWEEAKDKALSLDRFALLSIDPLNFLGELARLKRNSLDHVFFVGITGSAGKTTTKDMAYSILSHGGPAFKNPGNFNNLIGLPLSLLMVGSDDRYAILEMGTNTPGEISRLTEILGPDAGAVTNIGPAHLEGFGGIEGVKSEKGDLFLKMGGDAVAVVNRDDLRVLAASDLHGGRKVFYGEKDGDVTGKIEDMKADRMYITLFYGDDRADITMSCSGIQFFRNVLCASGIAYALRVPLEDLASGLENFIPDRGRFCLHRLSGDISVVDDSYNSNPLSSEVAIENVKMLFPGRKAIFVFGDMLELGESSESSHTRLGALLSSIRPYLIFTYGELARLIGEGAIASGLSREKWFHFDDVDGLGEKLVGEITEGSVILVKGSRMMRLERVVEKLVGYQGVKGETA